MDEQQFRREVARLVSLMEIWTEKTVDFSELYLALYSDLETYKEFIGNRERINSIEDQREDIGTSIRLLDTAPANITFRQQHPNFWEREKAKLEAMYLVTSLRYQLLRGLFQLPKYAQLSNRKSNMQKMHSAFALTPEELELMR